VAKKTPEPKVVRVKCDACGREYDLGQPHHQFCRGFKGEPKCEVCEELHDEAFKCQDCGAISCPDCGSTDDKLCAECVELWDSEEEG
jgi:hypothetical protein